MDCQKGTLHHKVLLTPVKPEILVVKSDKKWDGKEILVHFLLFLCRNESVKIEC